MFGPKVDDHDVGVCLTLFCGPVGGLLKVEDLVGGTVYACHVLAVSETGRPGFARKAVTIFIEGIEFCNAGQFLAVERGKGFHAEVTA